MKIEVVNASGVANMANKVKKVLTDIGFEDVKTSTSAVTYSSKSQISYSKNVSSDSRQKIRVVVEAVLGNVTEIEVDNLTNNNVLITITAEAKN